MKPAIKNWVAGLVLLAGVSSSTADGLINFFTFNANPVFGRVYSLPGVPVAGPTYLGQLWGGTSVSSLNPIGSATPFLTGAGAGIINFGNVTVSGIEAGTPYFYALRVLDQSLSFPIGQSGTVPVTLGGTTSAGGFFATPQANGFNSFTILPAPTTFTLAGLGLAALLMAHRRKNS